MSLFGRQLAMERSRGSSPPVSPYVRKRAADKPYDAIAHLEWIAHWLDEGFRVPNSGIRFGWDAIVKLLPVVGDSIGLIASLYLFQSFRRFGLSRITLTRMAINIGIDYFVGLIPLVGTVFDVFWKPNVWNVALLRRHLASADPATAKRARRHDLVFVLVAGLIVTVLFVLSAVAAYWLLLKIVHLISAL